jgi:hypothetical protein
MTSITIALEDDRLQLLKELATQLGMTTEDLVRISIDDLLSHPGQDYRQAAEHILRENEELYKRLS